jgi:hypothetical protein
VKTPGQAHVRRGSGYTRGMGSARGRCSSVSPQLTLPFGSLPLKTEKAHTPTYSVSFEPGKIQQLREHLSRQLGESVDLVVHDNRSTMISYRRNRGALALRVHRMFLSADLQTTHALADFTRARRPHRRTGELLDAFIRRHQQGLRPPSRLAPLVTRGRHHDLAELFRTLNHRFFGNQVVASIGWGRSMLRRRRLSIKMGGYFHETRTIRIHPALDHPAVPGYVVEFIVYHEMLHQVCPAEEHSGRRKRVHTRLFRARERLHPDHRRALIWEREHLTWLLGRRS